MSSVAAAAERLAAGELVLVGDESDEAIFVAAAADRITSAGLADLQEFGGGTVVLGMTESTVERLRLHGPAGRPLGGEGLRMIAPIDAASREGGGWSLSDRAQTMRVAARAESRPQDLLVPGHVLTAQIEEHGHGAAAAVLELARIAGPASTVALSAVLDARGAVARLGDAVRSSQLRRLAHVSSAELRGHAVARKTIELAVGCELPTRDGRFRAIAFGPRDGDPATVALVHGEPAEHADPFVHVHVACRLGDVFGSLLCSCRAELDAATERILAEGCGVIIYAPSPDPVQMTCAREQPVDVALISGLLRAVGLDSAQYSVQTLELVEGPPSASGQLEAAA
jgi:3,4-dihydroxy 2-butanone 4-phosphate synthase / GTP cyclohydrolase II